MSKKIINSQQAYKIVTGGNSTFTIVSPKTGVRFTYKVKLLKDSKDVFFVNVLTNPDNILLFLF